MKRIFAIVFCLSFVLVFSACTMEEMTSTSSTKTTKRVGNFLKTFDGGKNWENKVKIDETRSIGIANVISMAISPKDGNVIYLGTEKSGLYVTRDGAEKWEKLIFPPLKVYGLAIDASNDQTIYATGSLNNRAKIFKSMNGGKDWQEIYTEPNNNSVISSLNISRNNPSVLYCGTSEGVILKTVNGGQSWKNLTKTNGPITNISFDSGNDEVVYFAVFKGDIIRTMDGGNEMENLGKIDIGKFIEGRSVGFHTYSIKTDPGNSGVLYVGTDSGILKGSDFGNKWEEINILESSRKFPIRAIAINPQNSSEMIYSASGVIYKSLDGGMNWTTFQLNSENAVQILEYDSLNQNNIYAGLRKI